MVEFAGEKESRGRVQWNDVDLEAAGEQHHPPAGSRQRSNSNISIHSAHSRRGSIDPASALPIQYRTISFQIDASQEKDVAEAKRAKDTAAKG
jgi:sodium/potassium-transporting ATPase subunit alpha